MRVTLILSLLLSVLAVIFALQNPDPVHVELGPFDIYGSTALVLIATFTIGVLVGILATVPSRFKNRKELKKMQKNLPAAPSDKPAPFEAPPPHPQATQSQDPQTPP